MCVSVWVFDDCFDGTRWRASSIFVKDIVLSMYDDDCIHMSMSVFIQFWLDYVKRKMPRTFFHRTLCSFLFWINGNVCDDWFENRFFLLINIKDNDDCLRQTCDIIPIISTTIINRLCVITLSSDETELEKRRILMRKKMSNSTYFFWLIGKGFVGRRHCSNFFLACCCHRTTIRYSTTTV